MMEGRAFRGRGDGAAAPAPCASKVIRRSDVRCPKKNRVRSIVSTDITIAELHVAKGTTSEYSRTTDCCCTAGAQLVDRCDQTLGSMTRQQCKMQTKLTAAFETAAWSSASGSVFSTPGSPAEKPACGGMPR